MATYYNPNDPNVNQNDPVIRLIAGGTRRDIPRDLVQRYVSQNITQEEALAAIQGTPVFNPYIGPQVNYGQKISQQDYQLRQGENIDAYNARIAALRGTPKIPVVDTAKQILDSMQSQGMAINPNVQLNEQSVAEFLKRMESDTDPIFKQFRDKAEQEFGPYYATQLKLARGEFLRSVGYAQEEVLRQEQDLERKYGKQVRELGESAAERGFALSGIRQREERELAEGTQRDIETGRRKLSFNTGTLAGTFAQKFGQPTGSTIPFAPRALPGEMSFEQLGGTAPLYELSPEVYQGLVGSEEFARRGAVRSRASELEKAFRTEQALPTRYLNL